LNCWSWLYNNDDPGDDDPDDDPGNENHRIHCGDRTRDTCTWYNSPYWLNHAAVFGHMESDPPENSGVDDQQKARSECDEQKVRSDNRTAVRSRAGYDVNKFYIDSGATWSCIFGVKWLQNLIPISKQVSCGGSDMNITRMGSLSKALEDLPLPRDGYLFDEGIVANLLSLGKIADKFRVVMDTDIDDAIYVYGKDDKYL